MDRYVVILIWILIVAVILLSTPTKCMIDGKTEGFYNYSSYFKSPCSSCGWRTRYSCGKCTNCGFCRTASGIGSCEPGDSSGPFFRDDCMFWEYNDPYTYYPFSDLYPVIKTKSQYPTYRHKVRKPWKWNKQSIQVPS